MRLPDNAYTVAMPVLRL